MRRLLIRSASSLLLATAFAGAAPMVAAAQSLQARGSAMAQPRGTSAIDANRLLESQPARDVRSEFRQILERYPPVLGKMLKLDPGLMSNAAYLAPYPAVAAYLQQHPEIPRDPTYFLEFVNTGDNRSSDPESWRQERVLALWRNMMNGLFVFGGIAAVALTLMWIIRFAIEHRRWLRATKIQSEMQNKLLERMSSNNELLAYVQSPAGQSLLQGVPVSIDPAPSRGIGAPVSRILWSVQAGFVLAAGGAGLLVVRSYVDYEITQVLFVVGTIGVSLGVGFALAAGASYVLSQKLGLFDTNPENIRPSGGI